MRRCRVVIDNNIFGYTFYVVQEKIFGLWWNKKGFKDVEMLENYILELEEKGYLVTIKDKRDEN